MKILVYLAQHNLIGLDVSVADFSRFVVLSLGHSLWQAGILAAGLAGLLQSPWLGLEHRFRAGLTVLLLIGMLPVLNFVWLYRTSEDSIAQLPLQMVIVDSPELALFLFDGPRSVSPPSASLEHVVDDSLEPASFENTKDPAIAPPGTDHREPSKMAAEHVSSKARGKKPNWQWAEIYTSIALLYSLGLTAMAFRVAHGLVGHRVARKLLDDSEGHLIQTIRVLAHRAAYKLGWSGQVRVGLVAGSTTAAVIGCLRPIVVVNLTLASGLTPRQLEQILAHELAHLMRLDPLTLFLQRLVETTQFYNPFMWIISRQVSDLRELCCDQQVARNYDSMEYAETLVECATWEHRLRHPIELAISGNGVSTLRKRVCVLLDQPSVPVGTSRQLWFKWTQLPLLPRRRVCAAFGALIVGGSLVAVFLDQDPTKLNNSIPGWAWKQSELLDIDKVSMAFRSQLLDLTDLVPKNVRVDAMVDLETCRFAQWKFGDQRSTSVTLMVEMFADKPSQIFLDRDRNQVLESHERLADSTTNPPIWFANLDVEVGEPDKVLHVDRPIAIDLTQDLKSARILTLGYAEGKLAVGNRQLGCRRWDHDGDGISLSRRDEVWIDINGDEQFDELSERFYYQPWLQIEGRKFGLQSDAFGQELKLSEAPALGKAEFRLNFVDANAQLTDLQGMFRDQHGSFVTLRMNQTEVEVLPGRYCLESLALTVKDARGDSWYLTMSRGNDPEWFQIESEQKLVIDLLSNIELTLEPLLLTGAYGQEQTGFIPYLANSHGLIITEFKRNTTEEVPLNLSLSRPDQVEESEMPIITYSGFRCGGPTWVQVGNSTEVAGSWTIEATMDAGPILGQIKKTMEVQLDQK